MRLHHLSHRKCAVVQAVDPSAFAADGARRKARQQHCPMYTTIPWCCDLCTQQYHDVVIYAHNNTMVLWSMYATIPWCCDLCTVLCTQQYHDVVTYALSYVHNNTMMLWPMYTTIPWCCDLWTQQYHDDVTYALSYVHNNTMMLWPIHTTIPWCCDLCTQQYHDVVTYAHNNTMMLWPMHTTIPWCCDLCTQQYHDVVTGVKRVEPGLQSSGVALSTAALVKVNHDKGRCDLEAEGQGCLGAIGQHQAARAERLLQNLHQGWHIYQLLIQLTASRITHLSTVDTIPLNFSVPFCIMLNKGWHLYQLLIQYPWTSVCLSVSC